MAIRTETIALDVSPSCCSFAKRQCVAARQGDAGMVLDVDVTQDAKPMDLTGLTATLLYNNPDLVQVSGTVDGSTASFTIPSAGFSGRGVHQAYVQPSGAHDAYKVGDKITFSGKRYRCKMDGCVWDPITYPAAWEYVEDAPSEEPTEAK